MSAFDKFETSISLVTLPESHLFSTRRENPGSAWHPPSALIPGGRVIAQRRKIGRHKNE
jgi:hypothetical protein